MKPSFVLPTLLIAATTLIGCAPEQKPVHTELPQNPGIPVQFFKDEHGVVHILGYNGEELGTVNAENLCASEGGLRDSNNPVTLNSYRYNPATDGETVYYTVDCNGADTKAIIGN